MSFDTDFDASFDSPPQDETTALLIRARGFIERGWCRLAYAKDANGNAVDPKSGAAVAWCMHGALEAAKTSDDAWFRAVDRLTAHTDGIEDFCDFNNAQETVEPVLAAFDRAIAAGSAGSNRSGPEGRAIATGAG